jgi:hypothetical protein
MKMDKPRSRRKYLKYVGIGVACAAIGFALRDLAERYGLIPSLAKTITQTFTQITTETVTTTLSPLASYAKSKGLSNSVIQELGNKLGDKLTENNKALIDYLYDLSQVEVVSPEVLQFAPSDYKHSVIQSLQLKTIDQVVEEKVSDKTAIALGYLSTFPGHTQRWYIEQHGLDASAIDLLVRARSLGNQDFAKYAVNSLVCIQDHNPLTPNEISFLENPGNKFKEVRDSYLAEMESRGNPYDDFANDWRKMLKRSGVDREIESLDATEDWVYLVLNSDNPEVKEAEELKLKGGTPSQSDFKYSIPNYNTEQLVQYWLGKQNEFKGNDTLTQAIAMVNGLWVTIGDDQVRKAVYKDTNDLLNFFRETNEIQKARGYYCLEEYPLEAKVCLAWTGSYSPFIERNYGLMFFKDKRLSLEGYKWNTIHIDDLILARKIADGKHWIKKDINDTMQNIESYFFFDRYWDHVPNEIPEMYIAIDGERIINHDMGNPSFVFRYFAENGKAFGDCGDQTNIVSVFAKSWGISTNVMGNQKWVDSKLISHFYNIYYDSSSITWKAYSNQLKINLGRAPGVKFFNHLLKPPVNLRAYLNRWIKDGIPLGNMKYIQELTLEEVQRMYLNGVPSQTMKRWLFS